MEHLVEGWPLIVVVLAVVSMGIVYVREFLCRPTAEQIAAVKQWLVFATTQAEKELGSKTGQLKMRRVYDLFLQRFPAIARVVPFETFGEWVDEALVQMKDLLRSNRAVQKYVEGATDGDGPRA